MRRSPRLRASKHARQAYISVQGRTSHGGNAEDDEEETRASTDRRNIWLLIITTLLVLGSVFMFMPPQEKINQGLDIQGGLSVVLTAKSTDGAT